MTRAPHASLLLLLLLLSTGGCGPGVVPAPSDAGPAAGAIVTVSKSGDGTGSVQSDPEGIDCDTACTEQELALTEAVTKVTLTAEPARDALFESWTCVTTRAGALDPQVVSSQPDIVALDEASPVDVTVACTARFRQLYTLLVIRVGDGEGDVTGTLAGAAGAPRIDCGEECTAGYFAAEQETITAVPAPGSRFVGWQIDCASAGTDPTAAVTLDEDKNCEARFELE